MQDDRTSRRRPGVEPRRGRFVTDPKQLKKWLTVIAVVYIVFPRDLIPDFLGRGLGLIDDLVLVILLTHFYRKRLREHMARETGDAGTRDRARASGSAQSAPPESGFDPHEILGITPSASMESIRAAYKARMTEYHPDKVAHLGEDLRKLAHRKSLEIQRAYQQLSK